MGVHGLSRAPSAVHATNEDDTCPGPNCGADLPIVTPPLSFETKDSYSSADCKQKNIVFRVVDILKGIRPGSDLTSFQVPPQFNLPKSQLQCYAETVYCCGQNLLEQCADAATPLERFLAVVRWHISTTRPAPFGKAPYNPILGETHHVTAGDLNVLIEQVSHHPPISALHATHLKKKVEFIQWSRPQPRFFGSSVEVTIEGRGRLTLAEYGEMYELSTPKLNFRFLPNAMSEWTGDTLVRCIETGLEATVTFKSRSLMGLRGGSNRISGKINKITCHKALYTLSGSWDQAVIIEEKELGKKTVLYDGKAALSNLKTPMIKSFQALSPNESIIVWSKLTKALWNQEWDKAREAKSSVEEKQRTLRKQRAKANIIWKPKYFSLTPHGEWEWQFKGQAVAPAPLTVG